MWRSGRQQNLTVSHAGAGVAPVVAVETVAARKAVLSPAAPQHDLACGNLPQFGRAVPKRLCARLPAVDLEPALAGGADPCRLLIQFCGFDVPLADQFVSCHAPADQLVSWRGRSLLALVPPVAALMSVRQRAHAGMLLAVPV